MYWKSLEESLTRFKKYGAKTIPQKAIRRVQIIAKTRTITNCRSVIVAQEMIVRIVHTI